MKARGQRAGENGGQEISSRGNHGCW